MSEKKKDNKKKKNKSILEDEIFRIMQASLKAAMDAALDDLLKDWKYKKRQVDLMVYLPFLSFSPAIFRLKS